MHFKLHTQCQGKHGFVSSDFLFQFLVWIYLATTVWNLLSSIVLGPKSTGSSYKYSSALRAHLVMALSECSRLEPWFAHCTCGSASYLRHAVSDPDADGNCIFCWRSNMEIIWCSIYYASFPDQQIAAYELKCYNEDSTSQYATLDIECEWIFCMNNLFIKYVSNISAKTCS